MNMEEMQIRQKVLAEFGEFVLRSDSLDEVLHEGCRLVAEALGADLAKVLEVEEGGRSALVKAGVGWKPGIVGTQRLHFAERSSETYALERQEPVVSRNIRDENRFEFADFLIDHGVVSLVNVPIFLPGDKPYGLLQVDSRKLRKFGDRDIQFLRTYATVLGPVIDRLHKVQSLQRALSTNERLMQELQHRVKNHISIVVGLVRARARQTGSDEARAELNTVAERIDTLRRVHEQLYRNGVPDQLPLRPFLSELVNGLCHLHEHEGGRIALKFDIADVDIAADVAVPLGLIANEFVTNSLKYAFGDNGGTISVTVQATDDRLHLCLHDNGRGLHPAPHAARAGSGTGLKLIEGLAEQLGGQLAWPEPEAGTTLCLDLSRGEA
ncbi:sensor histidine kinase [Paracoccus tibetensis]|uniref:histidine kinase n=1 Tax=Paracoccus tibetensis TaxID=336292 RepID=A0A1G5GLS1_9RHOB|nr:histidine kinase dimerization/phosphoacceptor domain -containing protein [Paracoccus tibetensis]SCY52526.1 Two-component sensor histidine kinase, contains HisKA and HATPase domains [Paracoccus tibetensis]